MASTDPNRRRQQHECGRPGGRNGYAGPRATPPLPCRLQTAEDVIDVLQQQIEAVRADVEVGTLEKARVIGQLASIALKAIDGGKLAARLEALEAVLNQRQGKDPS